MISKSKAVVYYRVSSKAQENKESIEMQKIELPQFAKKKNYKLIKSFQDDGISGEEIDKRPGFIECLDYIETGRADVLLVFMVDRIGRFKNRKDRNRVIELLEISQTSVDTPYEGYFDCSNEEDLNDLEKLLNESRRENVKRGIKVSRGHARNRLAGRFSGGLCPYGVGWDKEKKDFYRIENEWAALKEIFNKLNDGWSMYAIANYLNEHKDKFPKRLRHYNKKPVENWTEQLIRQLVRNDFYFTGIIQRTPKSKAKDIPEMDTGLDVFDKSWIESARREVQTRRFTKIDPKLPNRKRKHDQEGEIFFTDLLLHGLVRCGYCGWKLGHQKRENSSGIYHYYMCLNRSKKFGCQAPSSTISASKLDKAVWKVFTQELGNPDKLYKKIMESEFLIDQDRSVQQVKLKTALNERIKLEQAIERNENLYTWGDIGEEKYKKNARNLQRLLKQKNDEIIKISESLHRPKKIEIAVKKSSKMVKEQMENIYTLTEFRRLFNQIKEMGVDFDPETLIGKGDKMEDLDEETLFKLYEVLELTSKQIELYKELSQLIKEFESSRSNKEKVNVQVQKMIFKQKRAMLNKFIDFDEKKGIRVKGLNKIKLYFLIESSL